MNGTGVLQGGIAADRNYSWLAGASRYSPARLCERMFRHGMEAHGQPHEAGWLGVASIRRALLESGGSGSRRDAVPSAKGGEARNASNFAMELGAQGERPRLRGCIVVKKLFALRLSPSAMAIMAGTSRDQIDAQHLVQGGSRRWCSRV
ncbi:uncharacterized protein PSANT_03085 [Moesziomyces antarcticus]|uniref:Uncharacterized protein n=1 Tax=Pseudozyma antarctica TaxID=84753 RepID=A0A5C3FPQ7_PSEA2|nr:uncharacterized protein PSANT_03085 [Moesziomyces antarcticus]